MPNYELGKIYKVWDNAFNECYIGSTTEALLSTRMSKHRSIYKSFLNGIGANVRLYDMFTKYGVENCKIELLEAYPCKSRTELEAREGHHQRNNECVNKNIAGRTTKEYNDDNKDKHKQYYEDNKDKILHYQENYRVNNKEQISAMKKQYWENNRDELVAKKKIYYQENKESFKAKASETVLCECGCQITKGCKTRHLKSARHQESMLKI